MGNFFFYVKRITVCLATWLCALQVQAQYVAGNRLSAAAVDHYKEVLNEQLASYINKKHFVADVRVEEDTIEIKGHPVPQYFNGLPGIPDASPFYERFNNDTLVMDTVMHVETRKYLAIRVILSDLYNSIDADFIRGLTRAFIPFRESKGDRLTIDIHRFPREYGANAVPADTVAAVRDSLVAEQARKDSPAVTPPNQQPPPSYNNTINYTQPPAARDTASRGGISTIQSSSTNKFEDNLNYYLLGLVVLLLVGLIVFLIVSFNRMKPQRHDSSSTMNMNYKGPDPQPLFPVQQEDKVIEDNKRSLTSYFIKSPKAVSNIIENEVLQQGNEALNKYARAVASTSSDLYMLLEPYLNAETYKNLSNKIGNAQDTESNQLKEDFQKVLGTLGRLKETDEANGIFAFLNRINDKQLLFLLRDENVETIAVTMAQLNAERAQILLKHFDGTKKSEIITQIGLMDLHPSRFFKEVALKLSEKLPELEGMKDLAVDGLAGMLNILDNLPENEQAELLYRIGEKSPHLVSEIKASFIGFNNIVILDDGLLERCTRDIETTPLIEALSGYRKETQEKIIRLRPPREQQIIREQLEEKNEPLEEGVAIRKRIIHAIRAQLKNHEKKANEI